MIHLFDITGAVCHSVVFLYAHTGKYLKVLQGALPHTAMVSAVHSQRENLFIDRRVVEELKSERKKKKGRGNYDNFPETLL